MNKLLLKSLSIVVFLLFTFLIPSEILAAPRQETMTVDPPVVYSDTTSVSITITANWNRFELKGKQYRIKVYPETNPDIYVTVDTPAKNVNTLTVGDIPIREIYKRHSVTPREFGNRNWRVEVKSLASYANEGIIVVEENTVFKSYFFVHKQCQAANPNQGCPALAIYTENNMLQWKREIRMEIINAEADKWYAVWWIGKNSGLGFYKWNKKFNSGDLFTDPITGAPTGAINNAAVAIEDEGYFCMTKAQLTLNSSLGLDCTFKVPEKGLIKIQRDPIVAEDIPILSNSIGVPTQPPAKTDPSPYPQVPPPCIKYVEIDENGKETGRDVTANVLRPTDPASGNTPDALSPEVRYKCVEVDTAVGPIETSAVGIVKRLFAIVLSLSGGIAVILIITSGYMMMTSQGNAEKLQKAREILTSAIVGILFIIFSMVILNTIGVDILDIPGFNK
jgi:hypothetical protein